MQRTALLIASLLACTATAACDSSKPEPTKTAKGDAAKGDTAKADAAKTDAPKPDAKTDAAEPADAKVAAWDKKLAARVLAKSGLDVGGKLSAFDIINCESGDQYCQVCKFGGSPKIMAVGSFEDEAFKKDLKALDVLAKKYEGKDLKAFAVFTDIVDGKATTPTDAKAAQAKADAIRKELGITMPVVIPAPEGEAGNKIWNEYYNITASRTVMFADGRNKVAFSAVGTDDWAPLSTEIDKVLGS